MGKNGIKGSTLKIIAIVCMLIDHIGAAVIEHYINMSAMKGVEVPVFWTAIDTVMRCIGRIAFPLFIFLLVQGFIHTSDKRKYALRLFIFALVSEIPFNLAVAGRWTHLEYQNVFFTLFLGFVFMCASDYFMKKTIPAVVGIFSLVLGSASVGFIFGSFIWNIVSQIETGLIIASGTVGDLENVMPVGYIGGHYLLFTSIFGAICACLIALLTVGIVRKKGLKDKLYSVSVAILVLGICMWAAELGQTDYGFSGVFAIAVAYYFRKNNVSCMLAICVSLTVFNFIEMFSFLNMFIIDKYNGERGLKLKFIFYAFYPVHLFILYTLAWLLGIWPGIFLGL